MPAPSFPDRLAPLPDEGLLPMLMIALLLFFPCLGASTADVAGTAFPLLSDPTSGKRRPARSDLRRLPAARRLLERERKEWR